MVASPGPHPDQKPIRFVGIIGLKDVNLFLRGPLVHGMSRPLGLIFRLPHGLSNAVLLPTVTRFSWRGAVERYAEVARAIGVAPANVSHEAACETLLDTLDRLNRELQVPRLRDCCGGDFEKFRSVLSKMAADALDSGSPQNNPIVPSLGQIVELYEAAW